MSLVPRHHPVVTEGATINELSIIFHMDARDVRKRLKSVRPKGRRADLEYYAIADIAALLMPMDDRNAALIERILNMHSDALPKHMHKEWWAGKNERLRYEEKAGDLWPTAKVTETASQVMRLVRTSLSLLADHVERQEGLTDPQRVIIQRLVDVTLAELRETVVDALERAKAGDSGAPVAPEEDDDNSPL